MYRKPIVVPIIIAINIFVFAIWNSRSGELLPFMYDNFLVSWTALQQGRIWTLLFSVFSHKAFYHILLNMLVLWSFGPILELRMGAWSFFNFYIIAGLFSSLAHAVTCAFILHQPQLPALGASGAVAAVILLFSFLYPKEKILIFGIIPVPALWGALAFIGMDLWGLMAQAQGGGLPIGHGAHLGGSFIGIMYYFLFLRSPRRF